MKPTGEAHHRNNEHALGTTTKHLLAIDVRPQGLRGRESDTRGEETHTMVWCLSAKPALVVYTHSYTCGAALCCAVLRQLCTVKKTTYLPCDVPSGRVVHPASVYVTTTGE